MTILKKSWEWSQIPFEAEKLRDYGIGPELTKLHNGLVLFRREYDYIN